MTRPARPLARRAREALFAHLRGNEDGITMAIFAVALVILLGLVALGIDSSRGFDERRLAQNAADHAAIAAAYASCTTSDPDIVAAARAAGLASADENGYDDNGTTNEVTIDVAPGAAAGTHEYQATVETTIATTFGQILGDDDLDTNGSAIAEATGCDAAGNSPGAVFGGGTCPSAGKFSVETGGQNHRVFGGIHSNDEMDLGSTNDFDDEASAGDYVTYTTVLKAGSESGDDFESPYPRQESPAKPWPDGLAPGTVTGSVTGAPAAGTFLKPYYDLADANGTTAANDTLFTDKVVAVTKNGVYYTTHTDGMDISTWSSSATNVTLIATRGPIKVSTGDLTGDTITPVAHASLPMTGLMILSNKVYTGDEACDKYVVHISAQHSTWSNGIIWGPRGQVEMAASNTTLIGSLVGHAVKLNGSDHFIRAMPSTGVVSPNVVLLQ